MRSEYKEYNLHLRTHNWRCLCFVFSSTKILDNFSYQLWISNSSHVYLWLNAFAKIGLKVCDMGWHTKLMMNLTKLTLNMKNNERRSHKRKQIQRIMKTFRITDKRKAWGKQNKFLYWDNLETQLFGNSLNNVGRHLYVSVPVRVRNLYQGERGRVPLKTKPFSYLLSALYPSLHSFPSFRAMLLCAVSIKAFYKCIFIWFLAWKRQPIEVSLLSLYFRNELITCFCVIV